MDINKEFGRVANGYKPAPKKSKTHGNLLQNGLIVEFNKPFAVLNMLKATKYKHVFKKSLKVVATIER